MKRKKASHDANAGRRVAAVDSSAADPDVDLSVSPDVDASNPTNHHLREIDGQPRSLLHFVLKSC